MELGEIINVVTKEIIDNGKYMFMSIVNIGNKLHFYKHCPNRKFPSNTAILTIGKYKYFYKITWHVLHRSNDEENVTHWSWSKAG